MKILYFYLLLLLFIGNSENIFAQIAQKEVNVNININKEIGTIRALNGGQLSPICNFKLLDLSEEFKALHIPIVRLHDAPWFNDNVVDVHMIFRDFKQDPSKEENYDFRQTDAYLSAILATGSKVVFRLGESIEHTKEKYFVNPPTDYPKWAAICRGIIRHYNKGWNNGFHHNIQFWEIYNEPDNTQMWTGTPEQFYKLYEVAAKAIKKEFPEISVGGPGMASPMAIANGKASATEYTKGFLEHCRKQLVPLDFFSWHSYISNPWNLAVQPSFIRELLNQYGFNKTQSHLNEWNYIPEVELEWRRLFGTGIWQGAIRKQAYEELSGCKGASFIANVLMLLQDEPVDVANFYTTTAGLFGIFSEYGEPRKTYHAFRAFAELLKTPVRLETEYNKTDGIVVCAGKNKTKTNILVSNFSEILQLTIINLNISGNIPGAQTKVEIYLLDESKDLAKIKEFEIKSNGKTIQLSQLIPSAAVLLISLEN